MPELPKWAVTDRFDIQARAPGNPTKDQMRLMMQSLLADRFKVVVHTETRQLPVFSLVLVKPGKTGSQLQPHPKDASCSMTPPPGAAPGSSVAPPSPTVAGGFPATCGGLVELQPSAPGRVNFGARNSPIGILAVSLTGWGNLDRPILDETGLTGNFDYHLEWTPEFNGPPPPNFQPDTSGPTFTEALRDQFGVKLVPKTGRWKSLSWTMWSIPPRTDDGACDAQPPVRCTTPLALLSHNVSSPRLTASRAVDPERYGCQSTRNDFPSKKAGCFVHRGVAVFFMLLALSFFDLRAFAASEHHGQVTFGGLPVPGATVTATQGRQAPGRHHRSAGRVYVH